VSKNTNTSYTYAKAESSQEKNLCEMQKNSGFDIESLTKIQTVLLEERGGGAT
jgi:hypothetical protein